MSPGVPHRYTAGRPPPAPRGLCADGLQCERQAEPRGALQQQVRVADNHQRHRPCALCDRHAQVGTDSGGLSRGQGEALALISIGDVVQAQLDVASSRSFRR